MSVYENKCNFDKDYEKIYNYSRSVKWNNIFELEIFYRIDLIDID